jgi:hypothetical protein
MFLGLGIPSSATLANTKDLTSPFVRATWPPCAFSITGLPITPELTGYESVIAILIPIFGGGLRCLDPFITQIGLSNYASVAYAGSPGQNRIVGVVVPAWFEAHAGFPCNGWRTVKGLSSIEMAPHGVLIVPGRMSLAAHELGHTFGLSADTTIPGRTSPFAFPTLPFFTPGAWDEYNHRDSRAKKGNRAQGVWLDQGVPEPSFVPSLLNKQQCNSHCFMGNSTSGTTAGNWNTEKKRWIDSGDYEQLIRKLQIEEDSAALLTTEAPAEDPEVLLVTGVLTRNERVAFAPWYRLPNGAVDLKLGSRGHYAFVFLDGRGNILGQAGFTPPHTVPDYDEEIGFTPFSLNLPLPKGTVRVELRNVMAGKALGWRNFSSNAPRIKIVRPQGHLTINQGEMLRMSWAGSDADGDRLVYSAMVSADGGITWEAIRFSTAETSATLRTDSFPVGSTLRLRVVVTDGVHTAEAFGAPIAITNR